MSVIKMCDAINMPDGSEIESISPDDNCLCTNTQAEILTWIVERTPGLEIGDKLVIEHGPFGYDVSIGKIDLGGDARERQH